jgi:hypothetical protein
LDQENVMAVRVKLSDGTEVLVEATLDELTDALRSARERGDVLKIERPNGQRIAITPQAVETIEEAPEEEAALRQQFADRAGAGV